jgi:DNA-binding ferritin-like protein
MSKTRKMKRGGKKSSNSGESVKTPILSSSSKSKSKSISSTNKYSHANLVIMFLRMLNTVKLYHWKTSSFAQHKATDELYTNLNASIDSFVEIMLGKDGTRVNLTSVKSIPLHDYTNLSDFKQEVDMYKEYLKNLNKEGTDLLNIRDEILGHLNQFTYLLTFK